VVYVFVHSLIVWLPGWAMLTGLIAVISGVSVLITFLVRRRFPQIAGGGRNDALNFGYGAVALVYAFFTGFVVSGLWDQNTAEDTQSRIEGASGVELARNISAFEPADVDRIRQSMLDYVRAAEAEWPLADKGQSLPEADNALAALIQTFREAGSRVDRPELIPLANTFHNLEQLSRSRTDRLLEGEVNDGPSWSLWAVIILTSGLVIGCTIIYGVASRVMHFSVVAIVAAMVATNLFLVLVLAHRCLADKCHGDPTATPAALQIIADAVK
jgi:hypothetical protein